MTTTFVSDSLLTIAVPANAITALGEIDVQVFTITPSCDPRHGNEASSNVLTFAVTPATPRVIESASVTDDGGEALGGDSERASVSPRGRIVVFDSAADNLVPSDTNSSFDIFLRNTCIRAVATENCKPSTSLVSVASDGTRGNGDSTNPAINVPTIDSILRFIAFQSSADNLVAGDTNGVVDVFVRDTCSDAPAGCTPSTIRVSVASDGSKGDGDSINPAISGDGRFVVFQSSSTNFTANDTNGAFDIFVRDTCIGAENDCVPSTTPVSVSMSGDLGDGFSVNPANTDGRFIAFQSAATNLVPDDSNGSEDIFIRDTCAGQPGCTPSTIRVSVASDGAQSNNNSATPSTSDAGRFIAFASLADNLVPKDTNNRWDVFVRDTCILAPPGCVTSTRRVSVASDGSQSEGDALEAGIRPSITVGGRYVAFSSNAANLAASDTNGSPDIFVRDTCHGFFAVPPGCRPSTMRLSVASGGKDANGGSVLPSISSDGGFVVFSSDSTNLVTKDTNGQADIYLSLY